MSNPLPFSIVLHQFMLLRAQASDEWHAMKAVTVGSMPVLSAGELLKAGNLAATAPLGRAIRRFVKELPDRQLYALLALIYAGRDKAADPVSHWHTKIRSTVASRSAAVEVILEKEPAAEYIRSAVEILMPGIELDSLPSLLAKAE